MFAPLTEDPDVISEIHLLHPSRPSRIATSIRAARRFMDMFGEIKKKKKGITCASSARVHVVVDDACARHQGEIDARRRCASTYAAEKGRRERRRREGAAREYSGRQGFVSLSVGNQVSGPVGRPLSISVLLAVYNTLRASLSRTLTPSSSLFSSIHPLFLSIGPLQCSPSLFLLPSLSLSVNLSRPLVA